MNRDNRFMGDNGGYPFITATDIYLDSLLEEKENVKGPIQLSFDVLDIDCGSLFLRVD